MPWFDWSALAKQRLGFKPLRIGKPLTRKTRNIGHEPAPPLT